MRAYPNPEADYHFLPNFYSKTLSSGSDQPTDPYGLADILCETGFAEVEIIPPEFDSGLAKEFGIYGPCHFLIARKR